MTRLGFDEFANAVVRERWMQRVPLHTIAAEARLTVEEVLERVPSLGLPARHPGTVAGLMPRFTTGPLPVPPLD